MVRIKNIPFIPKKKKRVGAITEPGLAMVSAVYSINDGLVTLTFDRAINTDDIDTHAFKLYDGIYATQILDGATYGPVGTDGITIYFDQTEYYSSSTCLMNVIAASGIKDAVTGEPWAGVTDYAVTIG